MKKMIAALIVLMMIAASVVPAAAADGGAGSAGDNRFTVLAEDVEFDPAKDKFVDLYIDVADNDDGFEYLKFYVIYPECLTLADMSATGVATQNDLTAGTERTEPDFIFRRSLMELRGYDVGYGDGLDTPEQASAYEALKHEMLDGKKWTSALFDFERSVYDEEADTEYTSDFFENGRICRIRFTYDPSLNPDGEDLGIELWSDPEGALHSSNPVNPEWVDEWAYYDAFGCTVRIAKRDPFELSVSDATVQRGDTEVSFDVEIANNPGLWSCQIFFIYDDRMTFSSFETGDVFTDSDIVFSPNTTEGMRDQDFETAFQKAVMKSMKNEVEKEGIDIEGKIFTQIQFENSEIAEEYEDGKLFTIRLDPSKLPVGEYDISICCVPGNTINLNYVSPAFKIVRQGKLTVEGEDCPHASLVVSKTVEPTCTKEGYVDYVCEECGCIIKTGEKTPALGHDFSIVAEVVEPTETEYGYTNYKCSRCGEIHADDFKDPLGGEEPEDPGTVLPGAVPLIALSEATVEKAGDTATLEATLGYNPGLWSAQVMVLYDRNISCTYFENGEVFSDDALSFSPATNEKMRDREGAQIDNMDAFRDAKKTLEAKNIDYRDKLFTLVQYENPDIDNVRENGRLFTIDLKTGYLEAGEYDIYIVSVPGNTININYDEVEFACFHGKITVLEGAPACEHEYAESGSVEATCTIAGYCKYVCGKCGDSYTEHIPPKGHSYVTGDSSDPTCTDVGVTWMKCTECGFIDIDTEPALGHDFSIEVETVMTSDDGESGYTVLKCSRCGETKKEYFGDVEPESGLPAAGVEAPYFTDRPVIDGIVSEDEWGEPTVYVSQALVGGAKVTAQGDIPEINDSNTFFFGLPYGGYDAQSLNMSYTMWLRWDEEHFYIAVKVNDPDGHSLKRGCSGMWNGDSFRTRIDPEGYNASCVLGPEQYDAEFDGPPWSRNDVSDMVFGFEQYYNGFTNAWDLTNDRGLMPYDGGRAEVSVAPSGAVYTEDTASGVTTYEIAIPWSYIDTYKHLYTPYGSINPEGAIGREYGMSAVVYNADGCSGGADYNAALCWGSGILLAQQNLYPYACGGSNRVVLSGERVTPVAGFTSCENGYIAPGLYPNYERDVDDSSRIVLDYEDESDMDVLGYNCGGEWIEEENGNHAARWDRRGTSDTYLNDNSYLYPVEAGTLTPYRRADGSYTVELDVKVTGTDQYDYGAGTSSFGFVFGGVDGLDFRCEYDFDLGAFVIVGNKTRSTLGFQKTEFTLNEWHHIVFQYYRDAAEIRLYFDPEINNGRVSAQAAEVFRMNYVYFDDPTDGGSMILLRRMNCQTVLDNVQIYNFVDFDCIGKTDEEAPPSAPPPEEEPAVVSPVNADGSALPGKPEKTAQPEKIAQPEKTAQPVKTAQTGKAAQTGDMLTTYVAAALIAALVMTGCGFDLYRRRKAQNGDK